MRIQKRDYPNGSTVYLNLTGFGRIVKLENVPRIEKPVDDKTFSYTRANWEFDENGNFQKLLGYTNVFYLGLGEFEDKECPILNRHTFKPRQTIDGIQYPNSRYFLWYGEMMGGWYLS